MKGEEGNPQGQQDMLQHEIGLEQGVGGLDEAAALELAVEITKRINSVSRD